MSPSMLVVGAAHRSQSFVYTREIEQGWGDMKCMLFGEMTFVYEMHGEHIEMSVVHEMHGEYIEMAGLYEIHVK